MSFTFGMSYKPAYQRRRGKCSSCYQGILAGDKVMIGTGFWNKHFIKRRLHLECYIEAVQKHTKDWFFKNDYVQTAMAPEKKAELNRLRAKRYYIRKKGGEPNAVTDRLIEVEKQIALAKNR
jgi:hypothetical protein